MKHASKQTTKKSLIIRQWCFKTEAIIILLCFLFKSIATQRSKRDVQPKNTYIYLIFPISYKDN